MSKGEDLLAPLAFYYRLSRLASSDSLAATTAWIDVNNAWRCDGRLRRGTVM